MNQQGASEREILEELDRRLAEDNTYESGRILGSMCTKPHEFAVKVFARYAEKNLGDPGLFPGLTELERDLVRTLGRLFGDENVSGSIVSGGSEANIIACRLIRELNPSVKHPEILVSESGHASFDKSANLMGVVIRRVPLGPDHLPDLGVLRSMIGERTAGLVGIAGTTSLGLVEPIEEMAEVAVEHDLFLHVDAAFGGFVIPFLPKPIPFDFRIPQVDSLTADPHKVGMNVIPSGGFFFRDPSYLEEHGFDIPYLAGGGFGHLSLTGTRPGAVVASFWALLKLLGLEGYRKIVARCMDITGHLKKLIADIDGVKLAAEPQLNVVGITSDDPDVKMRDVETKLRRRGWMLGYFGKWDLIRVVCMPHVTVDHVEEFCQVLDDVVHRLRSG
ncbi:MAG: tyrosine decarboxylase MfnA [Promethearchaeota archaeon]